MSPGSGESGTCSQPESAASLDGGKTGIVVAMGAMVRGPAQQEQKWHTGEHGPSGVSPGQVSVHSCSWT